MERLPVRGEDADALHAQLDVVGDGGLGGLTGLAGLLRWPLAVLIFRPWPQLSLAFRQVIIGYSAACALVTVCGFFLLRHFSSTSTA